MKKLFILLLTALLLSSCGQTATDEPAADTTAADTTIAEETEPETEDPYLDTVEAEDFGGSTVLLRSVPAIMSDISPEILFAEAVAALTDSGKKKTVCCRERTQTDERFLHEKMPRNIRGIGAYFTRNFLASSPSGVTQAVS